jgi:hypothetical protein
MGKDLWFFLHAFHMSLAVLFTVIGAVIIFVDKGFFPYSEEEIAKNFHPAMGMATIVLAIIQPIMGALRPPAGKRSSNIEGVHGETQRKREGRERD